MRMKVLLVGGSPEQCSADLLCRIADQVDKVVAVDRGLDMLLASGIAVDLFCGDADSVGEDGRRLVNGIGSSSDPLALLEVERYNPHKDFTDLDLALKAIETRWGLVHIIATCLEGGLPDHFLAVMGRLMNWKGSVELIHDGRRGRILKAGQAWSLGGHQGARFSFIPLSDTCEVSEHRMRWELDHKQATLLSDLGISNELDYPDGSITCHKGTIVAWVFRA